MCIAVADRQNPIRGGDRQYYVAEGHQRLLMERWEVCYGGGGWGSLDPPLCVCIKKPHNYILMGI